MKTSARASTHPPCLKRILWIFALFVGLAEATAEPFSIAWTNNLLTVNRPGLPGGVLKIWYLEAFLTPGANDSEWDDPFVAM